MDSLKIATATERRGAELRFSITTISGQTLDDIEVVDFGNIYHDDDVVYVKGEPCLYSTFRLMPAKAAPSEEELHLLDCIEARLGSFRSFTSQYPSSVSARQGEVAREIYDCIAAALRER
jgi:hypothetical protein